MKSIFLFFLLCYTISLHAQPTVTWSKFYGNNSGGGGQSFIRTTDGGYLATGIVFANGGDVSGYHGGAADVWVIKLDAAGTLQWQKCLGGSGDDRPSGRGTGGGSLQATTDGGYILSMVSNSNDGDVSGNHGNTDAWIIKLNSTGDIQWQQSFGGSGEELDFKIQLTPDGGYLFAGSSASNDGDVTGSHGLFDVWVVKLNNAGAIQWRRSLGSSDHDLLGNFVSTPDNGCLLAMSTRGNDGNVTSNHNAGFYDFWIAKLDNAGAISWQKSLGGTDEDMALGITAAPGGYVIAGYTYSFDGDVASSHHGGTDCWIVRINTTGDIIWERCYGGFSTDIAYGIQLTADGGFIAGCTAETFGFDHGDITNSFGDNDGWLVKLNSDGTLQWQKCVGGSVNDWCFQALELPGNNYAMLGQSNSHDFSSAGNPWTRALSLTHLNSGSILPVDFRDFNGRKAGTDVLLEWQVAHTDEGGKFIIERSTDGLHFTAIATLGQNTDLDYKYKDMAALTQTDLLYYRIAAEDLDSRKNYTPVIRIESSTKRNGILQLMGNPVHDQLILRYQNNAPDKLMLSILDQQGRSLLSNTITVNSGTNIIKQQLRDLPAGIYMVRVHSLTNPSRTWHTLQFLKQNL